jgi:hypothetical protein
MILRITIESLKCCLSLEVTQGQDMSFMTKTLYDYMF